MFAHDQGGKENCSVNWKTYRIRRSDLNRRSSTPTTHPSSHELDRSTTTELEAQLQARLAALYGPFSFSAPLPLSSTTSSTKASNAKPRRKSAPSNSESDGDSDTSHLQADTKNEGEEAEPSEHEFQFSLFSHPSSSAVPQTIILTNDDEAGPGRILRPRPREYFFAGKAEGKVREEIEYAAVSGEDVLQRARARAWGLEVGWRVRVLRVPAAAAAAGGSKPKQALKKTTQEGSVGIPLHDPEFVREGKRTKPNKKGRVILREKKRKREVAEEGKRIAAMEREEAEKEKRMKRNREKKVKRRLKEKAKKAEGKGGDVEAGGEVEMVRGEGGGSGEDGREDMDVD